MITVIRGRNAPASEYIGRPTPLGNPYIIGTHGDRDEVIRLYRKWLIAQLHDNPHGPAAMEFNRLKTIWQTTGKLVLGCWCAPQACHGDVIREGIIHESV